jgi:hypothetical protein
MALNPEEMCIKLYSARSNVCAKRNDTLPGQILSFLDDDWFLASISFLFLTGSAFIGKILISMPKWRRKKLFAMKKLVLEFQFLSKIGINL